MYCEHVGNVPSENNAGRRLSHKDVFLGYCAQGYGAEGPTDDCAATVMDPKAPVVSQALA
jgi:hypothetical protein